MNITTNTEKVEYKSFSFVDIETKQEEVNGVPVGIIRGMASTFGNIDLTDDVIAFGAFAKTIETHKQRNDRPVRMMIGHDRFAGAIGGFPIDKIKELQKGLRVEGQINLDVQRGREAFSLAKMGVLTDLSIGFIPMDVGFTKRGNRDIRVLKEIDLREISIVDEPANPKATISEVKNLHPRSIEMNAKMTEIQDDIERYLISDEKIQLKRMQTEINNYRKIS